jgi:hypothetical protein
MPSFARFGSKQGFKTEQLNMNDTRKSLQQGRNYPRAFLNGTLLPRWPAIPLRPIVAYGMMLRDFAKQSRGSEGLAIVPRKIARGYGRAIYQGGEEWLSDIGS